MAGTASSRKRRRPLHNMRSAAEYTGFSTRQFKRWIAQRTLPIEVVKVNGRNYFREDDLDRLVDAFPRRIYGDPSKLAGAGR